MYAKLEDRISTFVLERGMEGLSTPRKRQRWACEQAASAKSSWRIAASLRATFSVKAEIGAHDAQPRSRATDARRDEPRRADRCVDIAIEYANDATVARFRLRPINYISESYAQTSGARAHLHGGP